MMRKYFAHEVASPFSFQSVHDNKLYEDSCTFSTYIYVDVLFIFYTSIWDIDTHINLKCIK